MERAEKIVEALPFQKRKNNNFKKLNIIWGFDNL